MSVEIAKNSFSCLPETLAQLRDPQLNLQQSPVSIPPPTLSGEAPTSQKRKASQLSTSSQIPLHPLMPPPLPPRHSRRVNKEDPEPGSLPSPRPRRRQAKQ